MRIIVDKAYRKFSKLSASFCRGDRVENRLSQKLRNVVSTETSQTFELLLYIVSVVFFFLSNLPLFGFSYRSKSEFEKCYICSCHRRNHCDDCLEHHTSTIQLR